MLVSISVTCRDLKEAKNIAKSLLDKKFVACANMWPVDSIYRWQGKVVKDKEIIVVFKSLAKNISVISKEIKRIHSYQLPAIIIEKIAADKNILAWVKKSLNKY